MIAAAPDVIVGGKAQMLEFSVADETAWRVGLSCSGRARLYVERLDYCTSTLFESLSCTSDTRRCRQIFKVMTSVSLWKAICMRDRCWPRRAFRSGRSTQAKAGAS